MGLFTNPVVLTDGTTSHSMAFRSQRPDTKSIIGDYVESAAPISSQSLLVVKHDLRSAVPRALLQRSVLLHPAANTSDTILKPITMNFTCVADSSFSVAELQLQLNILTDALAEVSFLQNLRNRMI